MIILLFLSSTKSANGVANAIANILFIFLSQKELNTEILLSIDNLRKFSFMDAFPSWKGACEISLDIVQRT